MTTQSKLRKEILDNALTNKIKTSIFSIIGIILIGCSYTVGIALSDNFILQVIISVPMIMFGSWLLGTVGNVWKKEASDGE